jgi:cytochrome c biogenesis protein CcmG, thiol:disulfide interchange protein DsbE
MMPSTRSIDHRPSTPAAARWNSLLLLMLVVGVVWIWENRIPPNRTAPASELPPAPALGHPAPDFTLRTLTGEELTLSAQRGKPVVLNFWATWCPPCRAELPELAGVAGRYDNQIAVIGVDQAEPAAAVKAFADRLALEYPIPLDAQASVSRMYGVRSLPTTFLIDRQGIIRQIQVGPVTEATLTQLLQSIYP